MDKNIFREIGLTEGETKIYLALIDLGSTKTGDLCKLSNVYTSKVYPILNKLIQKGLASFTIKENIKYFQATSPTKLLEFLDLEKKRMEENESAIRKIIPELMAKQKADEIKQSATIYEGINGIKTIFNLLLEESTKSTDYLVFSPDTASLDDDDLNKFFKKHNLERKEKGVIVKMLALKSQKEFFKKNYSDKNYRIRYTEYSLPAGINIAGSKVLTLIWHPIPTAYVIDSVQVAEQYKEFFSRLWKIAEE